MERISIITPIYHGKKYINHLIRQLEKCALEICSGYILELLLVNDDPADPLDTYDSGQIEIRLIQTDRNRGIHAARVRGLKRSLGTYVLFLDQDDLISPNYFRSQLECMEDKDAVVCRLLHEGKQFYDTRMPFESVINREYMISVRNSIISPGQVLMKKDKIPNLWKNTELKNNGADDWLLWLCMMGENRTFARNPKILFEHVVQGHNESMNMKHMIDSEEEMYQVLSGSKLFTESEIQCLSHAVKHAAADHMKTLCRFQKMFFVYDEWLALQERGMYIHDYLRKSNIRNIAIYAAGHIGKRLYRNLKRNGIEVLYFIDMNAEYIKEEIPVFLPNDRLPAVDLVIVSLVEGEAAIMERLSAVMDAKICSIKKLLDEMNRKEGKNEYSSFWCG